MTRAGHLTLLPYIWPSCCALHVLRNYIEVMTKWVKSFLLFFKVVVGHVCLRGCSHSLSRGGWGHLGYSSLSCWCTLCMWLTIDVHFAIASWGVFEDAPHQYKWFTQLFLHKATSPHPFIFPRPSILFCKPNTGAEQWQNVNLNFLFKVTYCNCHEWTTILSIILWYCYMEKIPLATCQVSYRCVMEGLCSLMNFPIDGWRSVTMAPMSNPSDSRKWRLLSKPSLSILWLFPTSLLWNNHIYNWHSLQWL